MNGFEPVVFLVIGWLLGLLGNLIVDYWRDRKRRAQLKAGIKTELERVLVVSVWAAHGLIADYGRVDRDYVRWLRGKVNFCQQFEYHEQQSRIMSEFSKYGDNDLGKALTKLQTQPNGAVSLKKMLTPLLSARIQEILETYPTEASRNLLEVLTKLQHFNETVEESRWFLKQTFDGTISELNRKGINTNLDQSYEQLGTQARRIADMVEKIIVEAT